MGNVQFYIIGFLLVKIALSGDMHIKSGFAVDKK